MLVAVREPETFIEEPAPVAFTVRASPTVDVARIVEGLFVRLASPVPVVLKLIAPVREFVMVSRVMD